MTSAEVRAVIGDLTTRLITRRRSMSISQTRIADLMGISRPAVSRLETARRGGYPRLDTLIRYCDAVGLQIVLVPNVSARRLRDAASAIEELLIG